MSSANILKLVLGGGMLGLILLSIRAPAPSEPLSRRDLRRLIASALGLYGAGILAALTHRTEMAGLVLAGATAICALASWLSRGGQGEDEDGGGGDEVVSPSDDPQDTGPEPPAPDPHPPVDWDAFEQARRRWERQPLSR